MSTLLDGLISFGLGIYMALVGFGFVPRRDSEKKKLFLDKWGSYLAVGGILVALIGFFVSIEGLQKLMS